MVDRAHDRGISTNELEWLVQRSKIRSFVMDGGHVLPLFRTVRTEEFYKDYVYLARLKDEFIPGKTNRVSVLRFEKVSERDQKHILNQVAENEGIKPLQLQIQHLDLDLFEFERAPAFVEVHAGVRAKLFLKHNIDLQMIKETFRQKPSEFRSSGRAGDYFEIYYHGEKITLIVVLAKVPKKNTTSLVTSYFTLRRD